MAESQAATRPGRGRRIAGIVLIGLGVLLWADVAVVFTLRGAEFRLEDWMRFWFWLWVGALFGLTGWWLRHRARWAAWAAGLVLFAGPVAFVIRFGPPTR